MRAKVSHVRIFLSRKGLWRLFSNPGAPPGVLPLGSRPITMSCVSSGPGRQGAWLLPSPLRTTRRPFGYAGPSAG